jgi:hypothetical protein
LGAKQRSKAVSCQKKATHRSRYVGGVIVGRATRREYQKNPREFDAWVKANTLFGSILAIGMVAMALAGLNSAGPPDAATELSSITGRSEVGAE